MNDPVPDDLYHALAALRGEIDPPRDLWPEIQPRLAHRPGRAFSEIAVPMAMAAAVALAALVFWPQRSARQSEGGWNIATLSGTARIAGAAISDSGRWRPGEWLETGPDARVQLDVGRIGELRVEPDSRLRLLNTAADDHRIQLARGRLSAFIWAPPRLFFVETPSATAIDLGCAYTLSVDDRGSGTVHVTSGYVALEHGDRSATIPAGWMCETRPDIGPGTPFAADATPALRAALARFDFAADHGVLRQILAAARAGDDIMLWHLLGRAPAAARGQVFDRLAEFAPPPAGVSRAGIVAGDRPMREKWARELGLVPPSAAKNVAP